VGTAAQVHRVLKTPDGTMRLLVQGLERIRILEYTQENLTCAPASRSSPRTMEDGIEMEALMRAVQQLFRKLIELEPQMPDELAIMSMNVDDGRQLAYLVASSMRLRLTDAQAILEMDSVRDKLLRLTGLLKKEVEVLELGRKIQSEAQGEMERMQREFFLREQMKAIQKELGEEDEHEADIRELDERISKAGMAEEAEKEARRELNRMKRMPIQAAEYSVIKTYLDLLVSLPWQDKTPDNLDIAYARRVLDEDHYGLHEIKERILEFLAVRKLRTERKSSRRSSSEDIGDKIRREREGIVLCFVGPPGVGKTSLGISIARAMNRKFVRLALGGIRDEADIRGFRRTYIGSMPGRIIQSLRRVESKNPVFMLDEVDKLGRDFRGDPSSALLEVLDPEQNREFRDHYLDVPFDLSQVLFITTANVLDTIPPALRDRMEIIQLSSYTEAEKVNIAKGYLIPRQIKENGLRKSEVAFTDEGLREIIQGYTTEAGVRNLERQIGKICRKIAASVARRREAQAHDQAERPGAVSGQAQVFRRGSGRTRGNARRLHRPGMDRGRRRHHVL
jgi:ATP-dependent Lon protease